MDNIQFRDSTATFRVSAVIFGSVGEDDWDRCWVWKDMDMQL
jgi:hypothetical protein